MYKFVLYTCIAILAVFSPFVYFYCYMTIYQNVESKLQESAKKYSDGSLSEVVVLDSKILNTTFEEHIQTESVESILRIPVDNKTLQVRQDIIEEDRLLWFLGLALISVNFLFWIAMVVLLWKNKKKIKAVIAILKTTDIDNINALNFSNNDFLGQAIEEFLARVEKHYNAKKQLYAGIVHELKTPLAVIKAKCEVTLLKPRENLIYINVLKENIESVNNAQASIKTFFNLVNSEQMQNIRKINIQKELEDIVKDFTLLHKDRRFNYALQTKELEVLMDPILLRQIIQNFLQNAFKFTPKDKCVCLESYLKDGILKIEVLDEGNGVPLNLDVFAPFERDGKKEGMGLGLFLTKRAAKALGGEVTLENRKEKQGAIATFSIKI